MGRQETCEIPHAPTVQHAGHGTPADQVFQGLTSFPQGRQERFGDTRTQGGAWGLQPKT